MPNFEKEKTFLDMAKNFVYRCLHIYSELLNCIDLPETYICISMLYVIATKYVDNYSTGGHTHIIFFHDKSISEKYLHIY